jgi:hypothetical protein
MTDKKKTEAEKAAEEAAERQNAINEADAAFREDVAKAAEKRDKAIAKATKGMSTNVAEEAWNETKAEGDPEYRAVAADHRAKLDTVVEAIRTTGNADVVGLEAFEAKVVELLEKRGETPGEPSTPTGVDRAAAIDEAADKKAAGKK